MNTLIAFVLWCVAQPAAHTTADPKPVPVTGVVVESSGQPVSGADVWLVDALTADEDRRFGLELIWSSPTKASEGSIPIHVHGRTDAAGRFTLGLPPEIVVRRVPPMLAVWAVSNGPDPRTTSRLLPRIILADDPPLRLELSAPMRTQIIVSDRTHRPVARAKVGGYVGSGQGGRAEVGCDAEGRVQNPTAIAAGPLTLMLAFDRESGTRLRGEPPQKLLVNSNSATQVTIPL